MKNDSLHVRQSAAGRAASERLAAAWAYGTRGAAADAALRGWEWLLAAAGESVRTRFLPAEWRLLADCLGGEAAPEGADPAAELARRLLERQKLSGAAARRLGEPADGKAMALARKLEALDFAQAHAVAQACRWARLAGGNCDLERDRWWEPDFRRGKEVGADRRGGRRIDQAELERQRRDWGALLEAAGGVAELARRKGMAYQAAWSKLHRLGLVGKARKEGGE